MPQHAYSSGAPAPNAREPSFHVVVRDEQVMNQCQPKAASARRETNEAARRDVGNERAPNASCVAVVIPTFNRAGIVTRAIDSVLAQTQLPGEIIVIDDGSTDDTARVLTRYGSQIRVLHQNNRGVSA